MAPMVDPTLPAAFWDIQWYFDQLIADELQFAMQNRHLYEKNPDIQSKIQVLKS